MTQELNAMDAMAELTTDALSDPDYALPIIRAYLNGGGILSAGWALALVNEIGRLYDDIETNVNDAVQAERQRARKLADQWGLYWNDLYSTSRGGKVAYHQIGTAVWAIGAKI